MLVSPRFLLRCRAALALCGSAALALDAPPAFDYLAGPPDAVIKGRCQPLGEAGRSLRCKLTHVQVAPSPEMARKFLPSGAVAELYERLAKQRKEESEKLASDREYFERTRTLVCESDPRDFFEFRAAFHKNYDRFLDEAKRAHARICKSTDPRSFLDALDERKRLAEGVCALTYTDRQVTLHRVTQELPAATPETEATWKGPASGALGECRALAEVTLQISSGGKHERHTVDVKLARSGDKKKKRTSFNRTTRRLETIVEDPCAEVPETETLVFSSDKTAKKPSECRFLLDRYRDAECCAFE